MVTGQCHRSQRDCRWSYSVSDPSCEMRVCVCVLHRGVGVDDRRWKEISPPHAPPHPLEEVQNQNCKRTRKIKGRGVPINCRLLIRISLINAFVQPHFFHYLGLKLCNSSWQTGIKWLFYHRVFYTNKIIFKVCIRLCKTQPPH